LLKQPWTHNDLHYLGPREKEQFIAYRATTWHSSAESPGEGSGQDGNYYHQTIEPLFHQFPSSVEFIGEAGRQNKLLPAGRRVATPAEVNASRPPWPTSSRATP
jgi:hypothetical protein